MMSQSSAWKHINCGANEVTVHTKIKVEWLNQLTLNSYTLLPHLLGEDTVIKKLGEHGNTISLDAPEFYKFVSQMQSNILNDAAGRVRLIEQMNLICDMFECSVAKVKHEEHPQKNDLLKLLNEFALLDTLACFNWVIPNEKMALEFNELVPDSDHEIKFENLLYSYITPHRLKIREAQLDLSLAKGTNEYTKKLVAYYNKYFPLENFQSWIFMPTDYNQSLLLIDWNIAKMCHSSDKASLQDEINRININKQMSLSRYNNTMSALKAAGVEQSKYQEFNFLSVVATEEERRHIYECYFLKKIAYLNKYTDMGRSTLFNLTELLGGYDYESL